MPKKLWLQYKAISVTYWIRKNKLGVLKFWFQTSHHESMQFYIRPNNNCNKQWNMIVENVRYYQGPIQWNYFLQQVFVSTVTNCWPSNVEEQQATIIQLDPLGLTMLAEMEIIHLNILQIRHRLKLMFKMLSIVPHIFLTPTEELIFTS